MYEIMMSGSLMGEFLQVVPIACLVGAVYGLTRYGYIRSRKKQTDPGTEIMRLFFVCYLTGLANLVLVPNNLWTYIWNRVFLGSGGCEVGPLFSGGFNFEPTLLKWLLGEHTIGSWVRTMLLGNLLMFVPMGFFLPFVSQRITKGTILPLAVAIPVVIEVLQPVVGRSFDIDDLMMNFAGILVGYLAAAGIQAVMKKTR